DAVVRDATELGATRIFAVETARTVLRLEGKAEARAERWRRVAVEAARQAGRGDVPRIEGPASLSTALAATASFAPTALKLCLWEDATRPLGPVLRGAEPTAPVVALIGPEGGLERAEVDEASEAGFLAVSLGPLKLRTETVAAALLGALLVQGQA